MKLLGVRSVVTTATCDDWVMILVSFPRVFPVVLHLRLSEVGFWGHEWRSFSSHWPSSGLPPRVVLGARSHSNPRRRLSPPWSEHRSQTSPVHHPSLAKTSKPTIWVERQERVCTGIALILPEVRTRKHKWLNFYCSFPTGAVEVEGGLPRGPTE